MSEFNKSYLTIDRGEKRGTIHRDYIAHCFRWTHTLKWAMKLKNKGPLRVLDIGCGRDAQFPRTLFSNKVTPEKYLGIDAGKIIPPDFLVARNDVFEFRTMDAAELELNWKPNLIVCFEVSEHMTWKHWEKILRKIPEWLDDDGIFMFSTPCWNGDAAGVHINEITRDAAGAMLEEVGFEIVDNFGTFASVNDYKQQLVDTYGEAGKDLLKRLGEYYDSNIVSIIFAPMFPELSRNNIWRCIHATPGYKKKFTPLKKLKKPFGSDKFLQTGKIDVKKDI